MTVADAEPHPADFPESQTRYTDPIDLPGSWQLLLVPVLTCVGLIIFMLAAG
jgi:hypothetical protein